MQVSKITSNYIKKRINTERGYWINQSVVLFSYFSGHYFLQSGWGMCHEFICMN